MLIFIVKYLTPRSLYPDVDIYRKTSYMLIFIVKYLTSRSLCSDVDIYRKMSYIEDSVPRC